MSKKTLILMLAFSMLISLAIVGCDEPVDEPVDEAVDEPVDVDKEVILIGGARSQSGPLAVFDEMAFGPVYRMWADEVNERGGIYVEEYGKQLPVELLIYDDTSDMGTMGRLMERLMIEDEVDFILPPTSTAFLHTAAEMANEHQYLLLGAEGGAKDLEPLMAGLPYFFSVLNYGTHQVPAMVEMFVEEGVESVAIMFIADSHGIEYSDEAVSLLEIEGIEVAFSSSIPHDADDFSAIISDAQAADVDAFLSFAYPDQNFPLVGQCIEMGFSPDILLLGPGGNFQFFYDDIFGPAAEGIMSWGAWNAESSPEAAEFVEKFIEYYDGIGLMDWWGHVPYYASLEILEEAIEETGTLDNTVLKDYIANNEFSTTMGTVWFEDGRIPTECYLGQVGQWQDGVFEVIAPADQATAEPVIPKPPWPGG